ncbi:MAG TPA: FMN-dependent NADH-azoreductase [Stellaceae bacterium]|nr:FMN-dependent NADH-azoreductase [Stellaceae bacterium]
MTRLLHVSSSPLPSLSKSRAVAAEFVAAWQAQQPDTFVVERDLVATAVPHFGTELLTSFGTPAEKRTPEQAAALALADELIAELEAADVVVIGAPMHNFSIPSTLKAWIDHVARAGRTFRYTASGPEGLLTNKKVFIVLSRGGIYSEGPAQVMDFQEPYLRAVLGFLGLKDVTFIRVEGLNISPDSAERGLAKGRATIAAALDPARAA